MDKLKVLDLFSGIGGFSVGLEATGGFDTVAFCEMDPSARRVLRARWPEVPSFRDVRALTAEELTDEGVERIDVVCGGFPCQDISSAGRKAGIGGRRSSLWSEIARLLGELRPEYAIVENVSALLVRGIDVVLGDLAEVGYDAEWHCVPASAVGAPHRRDRVWIVCRPAVRDAARVEPDQPRAHPAWREKGRHVPGPRAGEGAARRARTHAVPDPDRHRGAEQGLDKAEAPERLHGRHGAGESRGERGPPGAVPDADRDQLQHQSKKSGARALQQRSVPEHGAGRAARARAAGGARAVPDPDRHPGLGGRGARGRDRQASSGIVPAGRAVGGVAERARLPLRPFLAEAVAEIKAERRWDRAVDGARAAEVPPGLGAFAESGIALLADGLPRKVVLDQTRLYGNAVVPHVVEAIGRAILAQREAEDWLTRGESGKGRAK